MNERIFITGATGLVGFNLTKHLISHGYRIVAGVRNTSDTIALQKLAATSGSDTSGSGQNLLQIAHVDLFSRDSLSAAMTGCSIVIHCAGAVDPHARRADIIETNVGGTRSALQAAVAAGVRQFIHISSLSVITGQEDQFNVDESAPLRYCGEAYADSKVDAEKVVATESKTVINWTVLRPGFIYGPGERAWMPRLIQSLKTGKAMLIDGGSRQTNVIYVENLARAARLAILNERAYGQVYNLTDGKTPSKKELFDSICDGLGLPRVKKNVPRPVAKFVCDIVSTFAPMMPTDMRQKLSRFSRAAFRLAAVNQGFSTAKAEKDLGYTDRVPFNQGMKETLLSFGASSSPSANRSIPAGVR